MGQDKPLNWHTSGSGSFQRRQRRETVASGPGLATALVTIATMNLFEMISSLADVGERAGMLLYSASSFLFDHTV